MNRTLSGAIALALAFLPTPAASAQCNPEIKASVPLSQSPWAVTYRDGYAYVSDEGSGLRIVDVTNPLSPFIAGTGLTGDTREVSLDGDLGYVANSFFGLAVLDLGNLGAPVQIGSASLSSFSFDVTHRDQYVYLADFFAGIAIADVSDPAAPVVVGTLDTPGQVVAVELCGNTLYAADQGGGIQVIDIEDPTTPTLVHTINVGCRRLSAVGSTIYAATNTGMQIIDASDPVNPVIQGFVALGDLVSWIAVEDSVAYCAVFSQGLQVVDVSDPNAPSVIGQVSTPGDARGVAVNGDYAYVSIFQPPSLQVIDVSGCPGAHQPWRDLCHSLAGTNGAPQLDGTGTLVANTPVSIMLTNALPNSTASLVVGTIETDAPFKGGTLVPDPFQVFHGLPTDAFGELTVNSTWPAGVPSDFTTYHQCWINDLGAPHKFAASNALAATTP